MDSFVSSGFCSPNSSHSINKLDDTSTWTKDSSLNCYLYNNFVNLEENQVCEFKGHASITAAEISPSMKDLNGRCSRSPVSRAICSFFNSTRGGIIFLGVLDSGQIRGVELSSNQREHLLVNLRDTLGNYSPPADLTRFRVRFVPIVYSKPETSSQIPIENIVNSNGKRLHLLRTFRPCWCEMEAKQQIQSGIIHPGFMIELRILSWKPPPSTLFPIVYQNEEGSVYMRGQGSQRRTSFAEVLTLTRSDVKEVLAERLAERQRHLENLRRLVKVREEQDLAKLSPLGRLIRLRKSVENSQIDSSVTTNL